MSNDYRIEKERLSVVVVTVSGERIVGEMFVQAYAHHHTGPEGPSDIMNGDEPFFPLAVLTGETLLIAKEQVREVEYERPAEDEDPSTHVAARPAVVEVTMIGAAECSGCVYLELPYERPRLLDYLNRCGLRFIPLYTTEGVRLLNRRLIERVRPLE
jgi:hypothetical protein